MDALGIECVVQYKGQPAEGERVSPVAFIKKHLERARQQRGTK